MDKTGGPPVENPAWSPDMARKAEIDMHLKRIGELAMELEAKSPLHHNAVDDMMAGPRDTGSRVYKNMRAGMRAGLPIGGNTARG